MKKIILILSFILVFFSGAPFSVCYGETLQEIYSIDAHIYSNDILNKVSIFGEQKEGSPYVMNIEIRVYEDEKVLYTFSPSTNFGYEPKIIAEDFMGNGLKQIFYSADSGGSGGYGFFYVFSLGKESYKTIFDYQIFSKEHVYTGKFLNDYRAIIVGEGSKFTLDVSNMDEFFKKEIWNENGEVVKPEIDIGEVNTVFPYYNGSMGQWNLQVYQKATAVAQVNTLGYVVNYLTFKNEQFESYLTTFNIS